MILKGKKIDLRLFPYSEWLLPHLLFPNILKLFQISFIRNRFKADVSSVFHLALVNSFIYVFIFQTDAQWKSHSWWHNFQRFGNTFAISLIEVNYIISRKFRGNLVGLQVFTLLKIDRKKSEYFLIKIPHKPMPLSLSSFFCLFFSFFINHIIYFHLVLKAVGFSAAVGFVLSNWIWWSGSDGNFVFWGTTSFAICSQRYWKDRTDIYSQPS